MLQEAAYIKNTKVLIFWYLQCLDLMYAEVAWVLVFLGIQVQPQAILDPDYSPEYLSIYCYNGKNNFLMLVPANKSKEIIR